jgi:hypothetical protein
VPNEAFLILGGGGLVGLQIARRIANDLSPSRIMIASLYRDEVEQALNGLRKMFGNRPIKFEGFWGDLFVREQFAKESRARLLESYAIREQLFEDLFGSFSEAYGRSQLVQLILKHKPDVIIDSINTATAISYQDVYTASVVSKRKWMPCLSAWSNAMWKAHVLNGRILSERSRKCCCPKQSHNWSVTCFSSTASPEKWAPVSI